MSCFDGIRTEMAAERAAVLAILPMTQDGKQAPNESTSDKGRANYDAVSDPRPASGPLLTSGQEDPCAKNEEACPSEVQDEDADDERRQAHAAAFAILLKRSIRRHRRIRFDAWMTCHQRNNNPETVNAEVDTVRAISSRRNHPPVCDDSVSAVEPALAEPKQCSERNDNPETICNAVRAVNDDSFDREKRHEYDRQSSHGLPTVSSQPAAMELSESNQFQEPPTAGCSFDGDSDREHYLRVSEVTDAASRSHGTGVVGPHSAIEAPDEYATPEDAERGRLAVQAQYHALIQEVQGLQSRRELWTAEVTKCMQQEAEEAERARELFKRVRLAEAMYSVNPRFATWSARHGCALTEKHAENGTGLHQHHKSVALSPPPGIDIDARGLHTNPVNSSNTSAAAPPSQRWFEDNDLLALTPYAAIVPYPRHLTKAGRRELCQVVWDILQDLPHRCVTIQNERIAPTGPVSGGARPLPTTAFDDEWASSDEEAQSAAAYVVAADSCGPSPALSPPGPDGTMFPAQPDQCITPDQAGKEHQLCTPKSAAAAPGVSPSLSTSMIPLGPRYTWDVACRNGGDILAMVTASAGLRRALDVGCPCLFLGDPAPHHWSARTGSSTALQSATSSSSTVDVCAASVLLPPLLHHHKYNEHTHNTLGLRLFVYGGMLLAVEQVSLCPKATGSPPGVSSRNHQGNPSSSSSPPTSLVSASGSSATGRPTRRESTRTQTATSTATTTTTTTSSAYQHQLVPEPPRASPSGVSPISSMPLVSDDDDDDGDMVVLQSTVCYFGGGFCCNSNPFTAELVTKELLFAELKSNSALIPDSPMESALDSDAELSQ